MLSPLQRELVEIVAEVDLDGRFAFAGAGALMVLGVIDRPSYDVDFFATRPDEVDEMHPRLVTAMVGHGLEVRELRSSPGFSRLEVRRERRSHWSTSVAIAENGRPGRTRSARGRCLPSRS